MVIYNLEENPDVFLSPRFFNDEFVYDMEVINGEDSRTSIRQIDLRKDKLTIYGTEVKEAMIKKLHDSMILRLKRGYIYVNCNGAFYALISGKLYSPIHNIIFDWSPFGVIVPNSVNDSLRKQLDKQEKAVESLRKQCEVAKFEVESAEGSLKASNDEVNELKMIINDMGLKLQKAYEKVALIDFELELYKIELESCKKESDDVLDELCNCRDVKIKMEVELQKMHDKLSSETCISEKRKCEMEMRSKMLEDELSLVRSELRSAKDQRELLNRNVKELEDQVTSFTNGHRDLKDELKKVQGRLFATDEEVHTKEIELQKLHHRISSEISSFTKINQELEMKSKMLEDDLSLVHSELYSTKDLQESAEKNVKELEERLLNCESRNEGMKEELKKVQDQLCMSNKEVEELKDQRRHYEKEQQCMETHLQKMMFDVRSINLEAKSSNQKLDQILIAILGKKFNHINYKVSPPHTLEIIAHEIPIH